MSIICSLAQGKTLLGTLCYPSFELQETQAIEALAFQSTSRQVIIGEYPRIHFRHSLSGIYLACLTATGALPLPALAYKGT
jgi:hypothetical protein